MKRKIMMGAAFASLALALLSPCAEEVLAGNRVDSMNIEVVLHPDGCGDVTQTWETYCEEGTEFYLYNKDSGYLNFTDFVVCDQNGAYVNVGDWDVNAKFDQKANSCGIHEVSDGVELCWGISEYGENTYIISYTIENLVSAYSDGGIGCFYRFVNGDMNFFPTSVQLTLSLDSGDAITEENTKIWGYGFEGECQLEDGTARAWTKSALNGSDNMTLLLSFGEGFFTPSHTFDISLSDVIEKAKEGSSYEGFDEYYDGPQDPSEVPNAVSQKKIRNLPAILSGFSALAVFGIIFLRKKKQKERDALYLSKPYFAGIPSCDDLDASYILAKLMNLCGQETLFDAHFTSLVLAGALTEEEHPSTPGFKYLCLHPDVSLRSASDRKLMEILMKAAKGGNYLDDRMINKYFETYYTQIDKFTTFCRKNGLEVLRQKNCLTGKKCSSIKHLSEYGTSVLGQVIGLDRYMLDIANVSPDTVNPGDILSGQADGICLWKELLPYAVMLGHTSTYEEGVEQIYADDYLAYNMGYYFGSCGRYRDHYCDNIHRSYRAGEEAAAAARASSGGGGSSSSGGGSGFSGGGGGGTR